jgi:protein-L-isoaspartate O-methyltransferase
MPRVKPRHLGMSLSYRLYRAARLVAPKHWLVHTLLDASWVARQIAWECVWSTLAPSEALRATRSHLPEFLDYSVPVGASVIDLGGGTGIASRLAAKLARRVVYVDMSATNARIAREECVGLTNVSFEIGEAGQVLREHGPFDVALMLHVLGYYEDPVRWLALVRERARRVIVEVPDFDADPLNAVRREEGFPCYNDEKYCVEFSRDGLRNCLEAAGWRVGEIDARHGVLLAVGDAEGD